MKNEIIYKHNQNLSVFNTCNIKMPVRINFYLQKNIQIIQNAAIEIDNARLQIGSQFGVLSPDGSGFDIPAEHIAEVNRELNDLFNLEQDLNIHIFKEKLEILPNKLMFSYELIYKLNRRIKRINVG